MDAKTTSAVEDLLAARKILRQREEAATSYERALEEARTLLEEQKVVVRRAEAVLINAVADEANPPATICDIPF
jgi:chromosome condensin MukBEF ATPase and DNA-binding subunit MukB